MDSLDTSLPPVWEEFREGINQRFRVLPIREFEYRIKFVPTFIAPDDRDVFFNLVSSAVVSALNTEPLSDLTALRFSASTRADVQQSEEGEDQYFAISYMHPVFDFAIQMGPSTLLITKFRTSMENLLRTVRLFAHITSKLFPPPGEKSVASFSDAGITEKIHKIYFSFKYEISLGERLSTGEEIDNLVLLDRLARVSPPGQETQVINPLVALQPDKIVRGDVTLLFNKVINHRPRQILIGYEGPWNVTHKDVDLSVEYRAGGPNAPLQEQDLRDFRTPFEDFYRQLMLKRFFVDLFADAALIGRA